jgi:hypothetical protein
MDSLRIHCPPRFQIWNFGLLIRTSLLNSVSDPHHVDADPDLACYFVADPRSTFHFYSDPGLDPSFQKKA